MTEAKISKTMRLSSEVIDLIEAQQGSSFTDKFENMVRICVQELPKKQQELKATQEAISQERNDLRHMREQKRKFESNLRDMNWALENAARQINRINKSLEETQV